MDADDQTVSIPFHLNRKENSTVQCRKTTESTLHYRMYSTYRLNSTSIASPGLETPLGSYIVSKVDSSENDSFSSLRKGNPLIREPFRISIDPLLDSTIKKSRNKN